MSEFNNPWGESTWDEGNVDYDRWFKEDTDETFSSAEKKIDISNPDEIRVDSRSDIIIVVDPGHGGTKGNTGSVYISSYKHKIKGTDGKAEIGADGKEKIVTTLIENLPEYAKNEVTKKKSSWVWLTQRIADDSKSEKSLVWDVAQSLKTKLSSAGYTAYVSRTNFVIEGTEDRSLRTKFANDKGAHYFISVHADGSYAFWTSGSHAIYRSSGDASYSNRQSTFATDVFRNYNVVTKLNTPRRDNSLQVLSTENKSLRKSLVELGFVTSPYDYTKMTSNIDLIAKQIAMGVEHNISSVYYVEKRGNLVGYYYNGKVYRTRELAYEKYYLNNPIYTLPSPYSTDKTRQKPFAYYDKIREYLKPTIT